MAAPSGSENPPVAAAQEASTPQSQARAAKLMIADRYSRVYEHFAAEPFTFQFFQSIRLLERMYPDRNPVGRFTHPANEVVRFRTNPATSFPASQIHMFEFSPTGQPTMMINFMGLTGPMGTLPLYYSELIRERLRQKDRTMLAFFDLFNHRMISFFYQAWEKYRFAIAYERGERDRLTLRLLDFIGLGTKGLQRRQAVRDDALLFYTGLFALRTRSAQALQNILADYFGVPVRVEQFIGAWYPLDRSNQCQFEDADSFSEQLGVGAVVGDEIWDQQSGVRIVFGPLTLEQYVDFLPNGSAFEPVRAITRFFAGDQTDFEIQLVLKRDEVPPCEIGSAGEIKPQLGYLTWAKTVSMNRDPGDTILRI
ncbi:MAG TPA: type VI secretion system baseplate subunit TssG [Bryobacteraceae bacterium]|jgi:type VI secretion system protein ImpH|nr:type VI secretion system baseplate subunit TssG [Bryobacteraceae bacterium]